MFFQEQLLLWITHYGYVAVILLLMLGIVGLPVPDEMLLTLLGYLVLKGNLQLAPAFLTALAGTVCGITVSYLLGRTGGLIVVRKYGSLLHITDTHLLLVRQWFDRIGKWSLTIGYFVPGFRHVIAIMAGTSQLRFSSFMMFAYSGAFIWCAVFITAGYIVGKEWSRWSATMHGFLLLTATIIVLAGVAYLIYRRWVSR